MTPIREDTGWWDDELERRKRAERLIAVLDEVEMDSADRLTPGGMAVAGI